MKNIKLLSLATLAFLSLAANAQVAIKTDAGDFKLTFKGRTHFDAAILGGDLGKTEAGNHMNAVQMNDTRFGFIASFDEKWSAKAEMCFANSGATFRDLYIGYKIDDKSSVQAGNFWMPFGYKVLGPAYRFVDNSSLDNTINGISRKIGVAYNYNTDPLKFTFGIFSDGSVDASKQTNKGYNIAAKAIFRPILDEHSVLHIGVAPLLTHTPNTVTFNTTASTPVKSVSLCSSSFNDDQQYNVFRGELEAIFISGKFYTEARYQHASINTPGDQNYKVGGFNLQAGFLLIGEQQNYNKANGYATNVSPKNLELTARYNHVAHNNGEDNEKITNDVTIGLNYAFNKYLMTKLNWSHGQLKDNDKANYNFVHLRFQFVF
ncbi:MAG: OprO/OprP family phosphate-selective porin [Bacteroidales bacterium]|nr:OprO/OprP family phosphate-selective porin [Bacteroidales bacterium]